MGVWSVGLRVLDFGFWDYGSRYVHGLMVYRRAVWLRL